MTQDVHNKIRSVVGIGLAVAVIGLGGAVGLAHADPDSNDVPTTSAADSTTPDAGTTDLPSTDKIGLVSITQVNSNGDLVEGSVIQLRRLADAAPTSDSNSSTSTTTDAAVSTTDETPSASSTTTTDTAAPSALSFPVGATLDVITSKSAVILALPEGTYKLTHLGTANETDAPYAGDVTIHVIAGRHVAGKLAEQPGTTRGAAPGVSTAASTTTANTGD